MTTNFDRIKNMDKERLVKFFVKYFSYSDDAPWDAYVSYRYCQLCPGVLAHPNDTYESSYCEVHHECPHGLYNVDVEEYIRRWLEATHWQ